MPLSEDEKAWAEKKIAAGTPKEQVFEFLASKRGLGAPPAINLPADQGRPQQVDLAQDEANRHAEYQKGLMRAGAVAAGSLALTPLTTGMSLIPSMATDFAGTAGADLLYQGGRKLATGQDINPMESVETGAWSAGAGGLVRGALTGAQKAIGALGGIPQGAISEVSQKAPLGGRKAYQMVRKAPADAEHVLATEAQRSITTAKSPSYPDAKAAVGAYSKDVDTAPIYGRILQRLRAKPVNAGEEAANRALEDMADRLPDKMTMVELEDYLQRIRTPVKDQIGQIGGSLKTNDVKDLSSFIRGYRDKLLAGEPLAEKGPEAFAQSSREMESIKQFRKLLLDPSGNLRRSAENTLRRLPSNRVIMGIVDRYDAAMGTTFGEKARALGLKRQFNPTDLKDAGSLIEMLTRIERGGSITSRLAGPPARGLTKAIAIAVPPRGLPSRAAAAAEAFRTVMEQERRQTP